MILSRFVYKAIIFLQHLSKKDKQKERKRVDILILFCIRY